MFSIGVNCAIGFAIIFVSLQVLFVSSQETPKCHSVHEKIGECVHFDSCPPLKTLLKTGTLTADKLRILQRLTCGFHRETPMICCPLSEIVRPIENVPGFQTNSQANKRPEGGGASHQSQKGPTSPASGPPTNTATNVNRNRVTPTTGDYSSHPSFKLLPKLKDCSNPVNSDRIVGGKDAALGSYPWQVRIGYRDAETNEIEFYCGGTVINKRYILTAAHCTEEIGDEFIPAVIRVGEHDTTKEEDCSPSLGCVKYADYQIEKVIPHDRYNTDDKSNDIELIRVSKDISFASFAVRPVCLPFPKEYGVQDIWRRTFAEEHKLKGWVTGWGRTKWNQAEGSNVLQEVQLPLVSNRECQFNYSTRVEITPKQLCAGGIKHKDSCGGDSGGPLLVPVTVRGEGKFFQVGVVSFGPIQCGIAGLPGVYSRVSSYLPWILDNIRP